MITHSPQAGGVYEGFGNHYNHLLCWAEADPVSLCFRALKAGEARRSRFQQKRLHNRAEEKKPHWRPKLTSFFLNNSTCVLALGRRGKEGGNIPVCSEEGSWKQNPEPLCFSDLLMAARPPRQLPVVAASLRD